MIRIPGRQRTSGVAQRIEEAEATFEPTRVHVDRDQIYMPPKLEKQVEKIIHSFGNGETLGTELGYRGAMFTGANGVGKTLIAHYIASQLDADLITVPSLPKPEYVNLLFDHARNTGEQKQRLQLLLFDEMQKYAKREDFADPQSAQIIDQLKVEMDGGIAGRYLRWLAMTDAPEKIDVALRRKKRLGKEIDILPPNQEGRYEILRIHAINLSKDNLEGNGDGRVGHSMVFDEKDLERISREPTHGFSGDDLWGLLSEASEEALFTDRTEKVTYRHLEAAATAITPTALADMPFVIPRKTFDTFGGIDDHIGLVQHYLGECFNEESDGLNILCYGDSGCGKSSFAEAVAAHYGANLLKIRGSALINWLLGKTGHEFEKTFKRAAIAAPSVLLLDEFASFAKTREYHGYKDTWTGKIRSMMDEQSPGVITIATLRDARLLEDETKRRFDLHLYFGRPDGEQLVQIWDKYLPEMDDPDAAMFLQTESHGFTGSHVEQICDRARRYNVPGKLEFFEKLVQMQKGINEKSQDDYMLDSVTEYRMIRDIMR